MKNPSLFTDEQMGAAMPVHDKKPAPRRKAKAPPPPTLSIHREDSPRPPVDVTAEPGTPERTGRPVRPLAEQLAILVQQGFTDAEIRHHYPKVAELLPTPPPAV